MTADEMKNALPIYEASADQEARLDQQGVLDGDPRRLDSRRTKRVIAENFGWLPPHDGDPTSPWN